MKKQFVRKTPRHHIYYVPADANSLQYAIACSMRRNMKRANLLCLKADNFITKYMEQVILDVKLKKNKKKFSLIFFF
jgi:hypothetical protein